MSTTSITQVTTERRASRRPDRRGIALALVLGAQLMIILDVTVVNIALPSIAHGLHFSASQPVLGAQRLHADLRRPAAARRPGRRHPRQAAGLHRRHRVVHARVAGRRPRHLGRPGCSRRARMQGVGGAIAVARGARPDRRPASPRAGSAPGRSASTPAVVMGGGSLGLVLGGVITEWVSWRWVLFINVPIGIAVALLGPAVPDRVGAPARAVRHRRRAHLDGGHDRAGLRLHPGRRRTAGATGSRSARSRPRPCCSALFVVNEARAPQPITPLRLFADRSRAGSYVARLLLVGGHVRDVLLPDPVRPGRPAASARCGPASRSCR